MPATFLGIGPWHGWPRLLATLLATLPTSVIAQDPPAQAAKPVTALRVGTAHPVAGPAIQDAVLLLQEGRILAIGPADQIEIPDAARLLHYPRAHAFPGLVDLRSTAYADEALLRDGSLGAGDSVADGLDRFDEPSRELLASGITTAYVSCRATSTWRGQGRVIRPRSDGFEFFDEERLEPVQMWLSTGPTPSHPLRRQQQIGKLGKEFEKLEKYEEAFEKYDEKLTEYQEQFAAYLKWHREHKGDKKPAAAPAQPEPEQSKPKAEGKAAQGGESEQKQADKESKDKAPQRPSYPAPPQRNPNQDALIAVRDGERALFVEVHRDDEIRRAIEIAGEHEIPRVVLEEASAAAGMAEEIAAAGMPVVVTQIRPPLESPYLPKRLQGSCVITALHRAGASVAIGSGSLGRARHLSLLAAQAAGSGLPAESALRAITLTPAEILGLQDQIGSLEVGKRADILISTAPLLESSARVTHVFVDGRSVWKEQR